MGQWHKQVQKLLCTILSLALIFLLDEIHPEKWTGDFTTELLELLWVLEATLAEYPAQAKLLSAVVKGPCFKASQYKMLLMLMAIRYSVLKALLVQI